MGTRQEILKQHYVRLAKRAATWVGLAAIMATSLIAVPANAAQLTNRKATLSDSAGGSTTDNVAFSYTFASSYTVRGIKFQVCNSPLQSVSCVVPTGATFNNASTTIGVAGTGGCATFAYNAKSATDYSITYATGNAVTSASTCTITINGLTNPTTSNQQFYLRVTTYTDTALSAPTTNGQDFGGIAVSTSQQLSVTANVQEDLTFCVGQTGTNCSNITGGSVPLSANPMTTSGPSKANAYMAASTNATGGYSITYNATTFTNTTADTITSAPTGGAGLNTGGTEQFGFNLASNSGGAFGTYGAAPSGGTGTVSSPYATNNSIVYNTAGGTQVASASGATILTLYTISFGANVAITTKAGAYTANQTFIATGTF